MIEPFNDFMSMISGEVDTNSVFLHCNADKFDLLLAQAIAVEPQHLCVFRDEIQIVGKVKVSQVLRWIATSLT